jgi:predicted transcriptional regulator
LARKKPPRLTDAELRLMKVLWSRGPSTVGDVAKALRDRPALAYSTVLTVLRILETKGHVRHSKHGRAFVYEAIVGQEEASRSAIRSLVHRFFGGSRAQLILNLLDEELDGNELARIKQRIKENG